MSVFHKEKIGRASIKEGLDNLPSGICFADQNGTIILCNRQMHRLCHALMGMDLQHISELRGALKNPCKEIIPIDAEALIYRFPNGAAWQFSETAITDAEGAAYTQMQAAEVTALYEKEAELQEKNRALNEANARAKKLYTELDKIVREEENFAVKTHVHDEVGLLLSLSRKLFKQQEDDLAAMRELGKAWSRVSETLGIAEQDLRQLVQWHILVDFRCGFLYRCGRNCLGGPPVCHGADSTRRSSSSPPRIYYRRCRCGGILRCRALCGLLDLGSGNGRSFRLRRSCGSCWLLGGIS